MQEEIKVKKRLLNVRPAHGTAQDATMPGMKYINAIKETLKEAGIQYQFLEKAPVISVGFENAVDKDDKFLVAAGGLNIGYEVSVKEKLTVPQEAMAAVDEYLMRANAHIRHGAYRLNHDTGAVVVLHTVYCGPGGQGTGSALLMMYSVAHAHMAFGASRLEAVAEGKIGPKEAAEEGIEMFHVLMNPVSK